MIFLIIFVFTAMCEMMKIMQENREVTCCLGSSANFRNSRLFLQSDLGYTGVFDYSIMLANKLFCILVDSFVNLRPAQHRSGPVVPVSVFMGDVWLRCLWGIQRRLWRADSSEAVWTAQQPRLLRHLPPRRERQHSEAHRAGWTPSNIQRLRDNTGVYFLFWVNLFQARHTTYGIRKCFLFLLQCQLSLVIIQVREETSQSHVSFSGYALYKVEVYSHKLQEKKRANTIFCQNVPRYCKY